MNARSLYCAVDEVLGHSACKTLRFASPPSLCCRPSHLLSWTSRKAFRLRERSELSGPSAKSAASPLSDGLFTSSFITLLLSTLVSLKKSLRIRGGRKALEPSASVAQQAVRPALVKPAIRTGRQPTACKTQHITPLPCTPSVVKRPRG